MVGGGIEDPVGLGSPPPPAQILYPATLIRACFTFVFFTACSRAPSLNNVRVHCIYNVYAYYTCVHVSLHSGWREGIRGAYVA